MVQSASEAVRIRYAIEGTAENIPIPFCQIDETSLACSLFIDPEMADQNPESVAGVDSLPETEIQIISKTNAAIRIIQDFPFRWYCAGGFLFHAEKEHGKQNFLKLELSNLL